MLLLHCRQNLSNAVKQFASKHKPSHLRTPIPSLYDLYKPPYPLCTTSANVFNAPISPLQTPPPLHHPCTTFALLSLLQLLWDSLCKSVGCAGVGQREGRAPGRTSSPVPATDLPAKPAQVCLHHGAGWPQVPQLLAACPGHSLLPVSRTSCVKLLVDFSCLGFGWL